MKILLQLFLNIFLLIHYILYSLFLLFIYGKLPKVSPFHTYSNDHLTPDTMKDMMDIYYQSEHCVSEKTIKSIQEETKNKIISSDEYDRYLSDIEIPIYNKKGEVIGYRTVANLIKNIKL